MGSMISGMMGGGGDKGDSTPAPAGGSITSMVGNIMKGDSSADQSSFMNGASKALTTAATPAKEAAPVQPVANTFSVPALPPPPAPPAPMAMPQVAPMQMPQPVPMMATSDINSKSHIQMAHGELDDILNRVYLNVLEKRKK